MNIKKGIYKTKCGYHAIVARIKPCGKHFTVHGAIEDPDTKVLALHTWSIEGLSIQCPHFDLERTCE